MAADVLARPEKYTLSQIDEVIPLWRTMCYKYLHDEATSWEIAAQMSTALAWEDLAAFPGVSRGVSTRDRASTELDQVQVRVQALNREVGEAPMSGPDQGMPHRATPREECTPELKEKWALQMIKSVAKAKGGTLTKVTAKRLIDQDLALQTEINEERVLTEALVLESSYRPDPQVE